MSACHDRSCHYALSGAVKKKLMLGVGKVLNVAGRIGKLVAPEYGMVGNVVSNLGQKMVTRSERYALSKRKNSLLDEIISEESP